MKGFAEIFYDYPFLGIRGETKAGEEFFEFYPYENLIWQIVIDLFYTPKANNKQ